jgi:NAD kinase
VTGKVDVQKESTVITLTNNKTIDISQVKSKMDNTIKSMDKHYAAEVKKVQQYAVQNQKDNLSFIAPSVSCWFTATD